MAQRSILIAAKIIITAASVEVHTCFNKKLCYSRWTARSAMPVKILSTVETSFSFSLFRSTTKYTTNRSNVVRGLHLTDLQ